MSIINTVIYQSGKTWEHSAILYFGPGGSIVHNWDSNGGEIVLTKTNSDELIIADRNIGASTFYSYGDTLSQNNCGYYFQWGNNYGFPWTGAPEKKTSSQVDASTYGPGNYYDDDTYFTWLNNWDRSYNANLWGGQNDTDLSKKGPCDNGYHVPSFNEWSSLKSFMENIVGSNRLDNSKYLLLPFAGQRFYYSDAEIRDQGATGNYRCSSSPAYPQTSYVQSISINSSSMSLTDYNRPTYGFSIRPFKNT